MIRFRPGVGQVEPSQSVFVHIGNQPLLPSSISRLGRGFVHQQLHPLRQARLASHPFLRWIGWYPSSFQMAHRRSDAIHLFLQRGFGSLRGSEKDWPLLGMDILTAIFQTDLSSSACPFPEKILTFCSSENKEVPEKTSASMSLVDSLLLESKCPASIVPLPPRRRFHWRSQRNNPL